MKDYPWGTGTPKIYRDGTLNDSDKSFTVPAGKLWKINAIYAQLNCTATVGNRELVAYVSDGANVILGFGTNVSVTASQVSVMRLRTGQGAYATTATVYLTAPQNLAEAGVNDGLPTDFYLPAGYIIRVYDVAAVDAAADDLVVVLHYVEYDV